ncbi:monovalent cation/H+ antiporter complex subunit F [Breznakiella homolactica]|uniref:pH regulation protein F n=1 Tax=Breznakiella homolactica TaxID=2798577 RepID=A0A7T7XRC8_9SPIR|nr:monovalent cation/H+ antiporter complex subunit F [Breznakiella homolactica]QQO10993.1 pH regulation protein F [Breznakiella homolactica]
MNGLLPAVFEWTIRILILCAVAAFVRIAAGPRGADRLTALSLISALFLAVLVLYGAQEGRGIYLDVALIYDVFGFLGILAIASFIREKEPD